MGLGKTAKNMAFKVLGRGLPVSVRNSITLAHKFGQYQSAKNWSCVNAQGQPIPWYTYPAIEYFDNLDLRGISVLEYGSGNSSLYFLRRGASVTSIEDNSFWYEKIKARMLEEHKYYLAGAADDYVRRSEITDADIVVIDGSHRPACSDFVIEQIKANAAAPSMIVFDNSDRFPKSIAKLDVELDWVRVDFCGFGPINAYTWVTSIYVNPNKKLSRIAAHISSISGTGENAEA